MAVYIHPERLFQVAPETLEELEIDQAKYLQHVKKILKDNEEEIKKAKEDEKNPTLI